MGNTIRRKPITFDIPKSPDYKYLNITNFNGLDMTDNLFAASHNTASDSLNVYVDEFGALTTRPRLEKKIDFKTSNKIPDDLETIGVYDISDGYIIHGKINNTFKMYRFNAKNETISEIVNDPDDEEVASIPTNKCKIIEKDDTIYLLDGVRIKRINYSVIRYVESDDIPLRRINCSNKNPKGTELEALNLMTDKYKESYRWDGTWNIRDVSENADDSDIDNKYRSTIENISDSNETFSYMYDYSDSDNPDRLYFLYRDNSNKKLLKIKYFSKNNEYDNGTLLVGNPSSLPDYYNEVHGDANPGNTAIAVIYTNNSNENSNSTYGGVYVKRNNKWFILSLSSDSDYLSRNYYGNRIKISRDGNVVATWNDTTLEVYIYRNGAGGEEYVKKTTSLLSNEKCIGVDLNDDGTKAFFKIQKTGYSKAYSYQEIRICHIDKSAYTISFSYLSCNEFGNMAISKDGNLVVTGVVGGLARLYKLSENRSFKEIPLSNNLDTASFSISDTQDKIYFASGGFGDGWFIINDAFTKINQSLSDYLGSYRQSHFNHSTTNSVAFEQDYGDDSDAIVIMINNFDFNSPYDLLTITKTIKYTDDDYKEWYDKRKQFEKVKLTTRFNNEYWYSYKNVIFHTSGNTPMKIPMNNILKLGEESKEITGFNLVGDDILIAYKKENMYIIQSMAYDDLVGYGYTESKNTQGNTSIGSPLITSLTEIPIQINNEGIFRLQQLENIETSDRTTQIISDTISKKWLNEQSDEIENSLAINHLNWTLIVLRNKTTQISKIYVLDNRNQSWYYWKIPIYVIDLYSQNKNIILFDDKANCYVFKKDDIQNKYNPSLTEYYDDGEKIINWYWKSQILPLGTINYSKKLLESTFIVADTDDSDEFGFNYKFKVFRKLANETNTNTITNKLNLIQSTTKRTLVPRFNFIQLELSNVEDDLNNNKMRLLGIGLKYTLLEALR